MGDAEKGEDLDRRLDSVCGYTCKYYFSATHRARGRSENSDRFQTFCSCTGCARFTYLGAITDHPPRRRGLQVHVFAAASTVRCAARVEGRSRSVDSCEEPRTAALPGVLAARRSTGRGPASRRSCDGSRRGEPVAAEDGGAGAGRAAGRAPGSGKAGRSAHADDDGDLACAPGLARCVTPAGTARRSYSRSSPNRRRPPGLRSRPVPPARARQISPGTAVRGRAGI